MPSDQTLITIPAVGGGTVSARIFIDGFKKGEGLREPPWREVIYQVAWDQSDLFMDSLLGGNTTTVVMPGATYTRTTPHQYPGNENLYCVGVQMVDGLGVPMPDTKLLAYGDGQGGPGWCHLLARYEAPPFDIGGTETNMVPPGGNYAMPWSRWNIQSRTIIRPVPGEALVGEASDNAPSQRFPMRIHQETIGVTFYQVPFIYVDVYRSLAKCLNDAVLFGWPVGQVIFEGYNFDGERATNGQYQQTLNLEFVAQSYDWNMMPRDDDMAFEYVKGATNNQRPYTYADLTATLR